MNGGMTRRESVNGRRGATVRCVSSPRCDYRTILPAPRNGGVQPVSGVAERDSSLAANVAAVALGRLVWLMS